MTKLGIFELGQVVDQADRADAMAEVIAVSEMAEELGFSTMWLAEHHFSNYGVVGATQVLAAAIASRTKKIGIGTAVTVIPFNHPIRTAEDFALVDIISGGRLRFGAGRAYQPAEFAGLGVPMDQSRELFKEGMDIIEMAWTQQEVEYDGEHYKVPRSAVLPKPLQQPSPPIYMAAITAPSFDLAIERGWNMQLATPFSYRLHREKWLDELQKSVEQVVEQVRLRGRDPEKLERALVVPFYVAETQEQAEAEYRDHVEWLYNRVTGLSKAESQNPVRGYEESMRESARTEQMGLLSFDALTKARAVICGDPEHCVAELRDMRDRLGLTEFLLFINLGGIAPERVRKCIKLTAEKVMPWV